MMVDETTTTADDEEQSEEEKEAAPEVDKTTEDDKSEENEDESKDRRSAIAQKKFWREKAKTNETKAQTLEKELAELKSLVKKPTDEQEAKAQEYIRAQARQVYEELSKEREKNEQKEKENFEAQVQDILDDNPDISEEELLDTIEELEVEPSVALKILKRQSSSKKEKPKLPKSGRASPEEKAKAPDDSQKTMFDILREETANLKGS